MTDLVLGPGDLAGSPDQEIFLPYKQLVRIQIFAHQAAELPVHVDDLRKALSEAPSEEGAAEEAESTTPAFPESAQRKLEALADSFETLAEQGQTWIRDTHPGIVQTAYLIVQYSIQANRKYQGLLELLNMLQKTPDDMQLRKRIKRLCERLIDEVDACLSGTGDVARNLNDFSNKAHLALEKFEIAKQDLEDEYQAEGETLEKIDEDLRQAEESLESATRRYEDEKISAITTGAVSGSASLCLVTLISPFLSFVFVPAILVTAGTGIATIVLSAEAIKAKADIDSLSKQVEKLEARKAAQMKLRAALHFAQSTAAGFAACAEAVAPQLEKAVTSWGQLKTNLETLGGTVEDDPMKAPILFRTAEIEASRLAWLKLRDAADRYRVHAFVRVLTDTSEYEEAEETSEKVSGPATVHNLRVEAGDSPAGRS